MKNFYKIETRTFRHFIQRTFTDKKFGIENILTFYGFDSYIFCSIDL